MTTRTWSYIIHKQYIQIRPYLQNIWGEIPLLTPADAHKCLGIQMQTDVVRNRSHDITVFQSELYLKNQFKKEHWEQLFCHLKVNNQYISYTVLTSKSASKSITLAYHILSVINNLFLDRHTCDTISSSTPRKTSSSSSSSSCHATSTDIPDPLSPLLEKHLGIIMHMYEDMSMLSWRPT